MTILILVSTGLLAALGTYALGYFHGVRDMEWRRKCETRR